MIIVSRPDEDLKALCEFIKTCLPSMIENCIYHAISFRSEYTFSTYIVFIVSYDTKDFRPISIEVPGIAKHYDAIETCLFYLLADFLSVVKSK